jgi:hypothetical protein
LTTKELTKIIAAFFSPLRRRRLRQLLGVGLLVLLFWQISTEGRFGDWWQNVQIAKEDGERLVYLLFALFLMPLNWLLETAKWRQLLLTDWHPDWKTSIKAVLAGISVSIATPNRIGEYGGRALLAPASQTANVVFSSLLGSLCQWIVFLGCGWPALWLILGTHYFWPTWLLWLISWSIPFLLILSIGLANRPWFIDWWKPRRENNKWWRWLMRKIVAHEPLRYRQLIKALLFALLRFWIYSFQYLLLLWFFDLPLGFGQGMQGIFSIYLIQAGIPLPPGFSVITRSELALMVWGNANLAPLSIVSATFSLYIINLVIPALIGALLIVNKKSKG